MKENILKASLASFGVATVLGLSAIIAADSGSGRITLAAGVFGLLGISSFFVGLVYPKN